MNEAPAVSECQDNTFDLTWHTQRAGFPWVVSSLPRKERRLFACFLSQDGCSRPDLEEPSWLSREVMSLSISCSPTPRPQREVAVESQCVWASWPQCHSAWGGRKTSGIQHSKWANSGADWERTHVTSQHSHVFSLPARVRSTPGQAQTQLCVQEVYIDLLSCF